MHPRQGWLCVLKGDETLGTNPCIREDGHGKCIIFNGNSETKEAELKSERNPIALRLGKLQSSKALDSPQARCKFLLCISFGGIERERERESHASTQKQINTVWR